MRSRAETPLDSRGVETLRRYALLHRVNSHALWICFVWVLGWFMLGMAFGEWAHYGAGAGFVVVGILILQTFVVYPFLLCPRCGNRFFLPNGLFGFVMKVNAFQSACRHCGQALPRRLRRNPVRGQE